jgi:hypothetical protein
VHNPGEPAALAQLSDWAAMVQSAAPNSRLVVALTHADETVGQVTVVLPESLRDAQVFRIDNQSGTGIDALRAHLEQTVTSMPHWRVTLPIDWVVLQLMLAESSFPDVVTRDDLAQRARTHDPPLVFTPGELDSALLTLHDRGVVVLVDNLPDLVFAHPQRLINATSGIVRLALTGPASPLSSGVLDHARIGVDVLATAADVALRPHMIQVLHSLRIAFPLRPAPPGTQVTASIIPAVLPHAVPLAVTTHLGAAGPVSVVRRVVCSQCALVSAFGHIVALQWRRAEPNSWWSNGVLVRDGTSASALVQLDTTHARDEAAVTVKGWGNESLQLVSDVCRDIDAVLIDRTPASSAGSLRHESLCPHCVAQGVTPFGFKRSDTILDAAADSDWAWLQQCSQHPAHVLSFADCVFYADQLYGLCRAGVVPATMQPLPADPLSARSSTPVQAATVQQAVATRKLTAFTPLERIGRRTYHRGFYGFNGAVYLCHCPADGRSYVVKILFNNAAAAGVPTNTELMEQITQAEHELSDAVGVSRFVFRVVAHFTEPRLFGGGRALRWPNWDLDDGADLRLSNDSDNDTLQQSDNQRW